MDPHCEHCLNKGRGLILNPDTWAKMYPAPKDDAEIAAEQGAAQ